MAPRDPIRPGIDPTSAGEAAKSSNAISEAAMWEQICHLQSDTRSMLRQSILMTDINKQMLQEQQQLRAITEKLANRTVELAESVKTSVDKMSEFMTKVESSMDKMAEAISTLDDAVAANDDNVDQLVEELKRSADENDINIDMLNASIEQIKEAALTLAYALYDDKKVDDSHKKAKKQVEDDRPSKEKERLKFKKQRRADREAAAVISREERMNLRNARRSSREK